MRWFSLLRLSLRSPNPTRTARPRLKRCAHLEVESLEERTVPATLYITPSGTPGFHTIQAAVAAAANGDIIQIEPIPGGNQNTITDFNQPTFTTTLTQTTLTIRGDPNAGLAELPTITGNSFNNQIALEIKPGATGIVLDHLNIRAGLQLDAGSKGTVMRNSFIDGITEVGGAGNGQNLLFNNMLVGNIALTGSAPATVTGDEVLYNHFTTNPQGGLPGTLNVVNDTGAQIVGNTFDPIFSNTAALFVGAGGTAAHPILVYDNHVAVIGSPPTLPAAIGVSDANAQGANSAPTFVEVFNNAVQADNASGIQVTVVTAANLQASIQGNDLRATNFGLNVIGNGTSLGTVDAGGGALGSYGANNFRGFFNSSATQAAIQLTGTSNAPFTAANTLTAHNNIFTSSVAPNPGPAVRDNFHGTGGTGKIDVTALDNTRAFIQTVYFNLLQRSAYPVPGGELDYWVSVFNTAGANGGQAGVVKSIQGAHETHQRFVDDLYIKFLGRLANNSLSPVNGGEDAVYITQLDNNTANDDGIMMQILSTTEFFNRARSLARNTTVGGGSPGTPDLDTPTTNYVQALYLTLLGRQASAAERTFWVNQFATLGLAGLANGFIKSEEFRTIVVDRLYGYQVNNNFVINSLVPNLLHRQFIPAATDLTYWINNTNADLQSIEAGFLGSAEFFANG